MLYRESTVPQSSMNVRVKTLNCDYDVDLLSNINANSDFHSFNTRYRDNLVLPRYRRTTSQKCILFQAVQLWNDLPCDAKKFNSLYKFKRYITEMLLDCSV